MIITVSADKVTVSQNPQGLGVNVELEVSLSDLVSALVEEVGVFDILEEMDQDEIRGFVEELD